MDVVGCGTTFGKPLKEMKINFNHETMPGERVELYLASDRTDDAMERYWVEGRIAGSTGPSSFSAEMIF